MKDAINKTKLKEVAAKYELAKKLQQLWMYDTDYVKSKIDILIDKGVVKMTDYERLFCYNNELDCWQLEFAAYVWREVILPHAVGITFDEYMAIDALAKVK